MPQRSAVTQLPEELKGELDRRLVAGGFAGYEALSEWLAGRGCEISKSALHRYGQEFEGKLAALKIATEQAQAIARTVGDDEGVLNDALIRLIQQKAFETLVDMQEAGNMTLADLGHMVARLGKTAIAQKQWMAKVREKAESAAAKVEKVARKNGLSGEAVDTIRREILGVAG